ncbi:MAG: hypothetical protein E7320_10845 [Clostridiales bacterium]|nr:hypothetical protein [Clostridiales bacterium]
MRYSAKPLHLMALLLAAALLLTGCTGAPKGVGPDEAQAAFETLCRQMLEYSAAADGEKVLKLVAAYPEGYDECTYMSIFNEFNLQGWPDYLFYTIPLDANGTRYLGSIVNSLTENGQTRSVSDWLVVTFADGTCKIDGSPEAAELVAKLDLYPEEMKKAEADGRFTARLGESDRRFAVEKAVIPHCFTLRAYSMWQNADGSLDVAVSLSNGTDAVRPVESLTITVTDMEGNELVLYTESVSLAIESGDSENLIIRIPAGQLNTQPDDAVQYVVFVQG